jgi:segregation and condensation protein A
MTPDKKIQDERCRIHLDVFEGPLDLLLYLIKRDEIDIYDIPINHVVKEYISFLDEMEQLDLNIAGEYLLMASLLMSIKARMLLPKPEINTDEIEDARQELVDMLVDYELFKKVSEELVRRREEQGRLYPKGACPDLANLSQYAAQEELLSYDFYSLVRTAWEMLKQQDRIIPGFEGEDVDVGERMEHILEYLQMNKRAQFIELFPEKTTPMMFVATFIGLLELIKNKNVRVYQRSIFGNIWIFPLTEES